MKFMIVLFALAAFVAAKPGVYSGIGYSAAYPTAYGYSAYSAAVPTAVAAPVAYSSLVSTPAVVAAPAPIVAATPVVAGVKSQYHAQDAFGQASYGHTEPFQAHSAVQDAHGNKVGSFSYVAPNGQVFKTDYVADALGYRVASNALPVGPGAGPAPVLDTPEVVAARAAHLALHHRGKRGIAAVTVGHTPAATAPLGAAAVIAPAAVSYSALASPVGYSAISPVTYSAPLTSSYAYSAPVVSSLGSIVAAPALSYVH